MCFSKCEDFYEVSVKIKQPEIDPKNRPKEQYELLEYWKGDNKLRSQLIDEFFQKESVFGGKFLGFLFIAFFLFIFISRLIIWSQASSDKDDRLRTVYPSTCPCGQQTKILGSVRPSHG